MILRRTGPHLEKRRFGRAAIGSGWKGWSLWLDDSERAHLLAFLRNPQDCTSDAERLAFEIAEAIEESRK